MLVDMVLVCCGHDPSVLMVLVPVVGGHGPGVLVDACYIKFPGDQRLKKGWQHHYTENLLRELRIGGTSWALAGQRGYHLCHLASAKELYRTGRLGNLGVTRPR